MFFCNQYALSDSEKAVLKALIGALASGALAYVCNDQQELQKACLLNSINCIQSIISPPSLNPREAIKALSDSPEENTNIKPRQRPKLTRSRIQKNALILNFLIFKN